MTPYPKFRAWHKELKEMFKVTNIEWYGDTFNLCMVRLKDDAYYECDDGILKIELMQWTGLTDQNNQDVYEGDIIDVNPHFEDKRNQRLYYVKRDIENGQWNFRILNEPFKDMFACYKFCEVVTSTSLIMGNIYEHTHLLKNV